MQTPHDRGQFDTSGEAPVEQVRDEAECRAGGECLPDYDISRQDPRLGFRPVQAGETNYRCTCADPAVGGKCPGLVEAFSVSLNVGQGDTHALSIPVPPSQAQATFSASWPGSQIVLFYKREFFQILETLDIGRFYPFFIEPFSEDS